MKYFFSESLTTKSGEEVSTREVKTILNEAINKEDKTKPLTDEKLAELLKENGYLIARRTVAKYREQLNIPVARLRKQLIYNDENFVKLFHFIFHPVFTVIYSYLIYFNIQNIYNQMLFLAAPKIYFPLFFFFLMAVFFPLLTVYIMYRNKLISSMSIPIRKERLTCFILL